MADSTADSEEFRMSNSFVDHQREVLEQRKAQLLKEFDAANKQLRFALGSVERLRLQGQIGELEKEICQIEQELDILLSKKTTTAAPDVNPPAVAGPTNLSFDGPIFDSLPRGWYDRLGKADNVSTAYQVRAIPRSEGGGGTCVLLQNVKPTHNEFGFLMQRCSARSLEGKMVRVEGELKTKNVDRWGGLWVSTGEEMVPSLMFNGIYKQTVRGTTTWAKYLIDAHLPEQVIWLNYGIVLVGSGMIWADNFHLSVWDKNQWVDI